MQTNHSTNLFGDEICNFLIERRLTTAHYRFSDLDWPKSSSSTRLCNSSNRIQILLTPLLYWLPIFSNQFTKQKRSYHLMQKSFSSWSFKLGSELLIFQLNTFSTGCLLACGILSWITELSKNHIQILLMPLLYWLPIFSNQFTKQKGSFHPLLKSFGLWSLSRVAELSKMRHYFVICQIAYKFSWRLCCIDCQSSAINFRSKNVAIIQYQNKNFWLVEF